jgi:hypothetical protein
MTIAPDYQYILLILNCKNYEYKAAKQRDSWLKEIPDWLAYFHVIGDENIEEDFTFDMESRILYVKTPDDYVSLPKKVIAAYNALAIFFVECKYIFKTDDDQFLTSSDKFFVNMRSLLESKVPKVHYAGQINDIKTPYLSDYGKIHTELPSPLIIYPTKYCSGRFYILSIEAIKALIQRRAAIEKECLEDYAIGYHLHSIFKKTILHIDASKFFTDMV